MNLNLILILSHFLLMLASATTSFLRKKTDNIWILCSGLVAVPVYALVTLVLLDFGDHAGNGTTGGWYLIFSIVSVGILPIATHLCAVISGVCAARFLECFLAVERFANPRFAKPVKAKTQN